jgi:hypothetical protein
LIFRFVWFWICIACRLSTSISVLGWTEFQGNLWYYINNTERSSSNIKHGLKFEIFYFEFFEFSSSQSYPKLNIRMIKIGKLQNLIEHPLWVLIWLLM